MDDLHTVRLSILDRLHRAGLRPVTVEELARALKSLAITLPELRAELPGLIDHGYVENLLPGRGLLLKLTAKGRDQVTRDAAMDDYIHGTDAYIGG